MTKENETTASKQGPLTGYTIIDLTSVVLGPYCTQLLGDLGADVIKIETPSGDIMRHAGPHVSEGMGPIYLTINRNMSKRLILKLYIAMRSGLGLMDIMQNVRRMTIWFKRFLVRHL